MNEYYLEDLIRDLQVMQETFAGPVQVFIRSDYFATDGSLIWDISPLSGVEILDEKTINPPIVYVAPLRSHSMNSNVHSIKSSFVTKQSF